MIVILVIAVVVVLGKISIGTMYFDLTRESFYISMIILQSGVDSKLTDLEVLHRLFSIGFGENR